MSSSTVETMSSANGATTPTQRTAFPPHRPVGLPPRPRYREFWSTNDSHTVALFSFLLGVVLASSVALAMLFPETPQCWLYIAFLCLFHFLEYYITAKYKPFEVTLDGEFSFFYDN
jgi:hypothetical protein